MKKEDREEQIKELAKKYGIDLEKLKREQITFSKKVILKDSIDFSVIDRIAGCSIAMFGNKIIVGIVVLNPDLEIIEERYFADKINFPYIGGFRAYRELPSIVSCYNKLENTPDLIFIESAGVLHSRNFGLASHLALSIQKPVIGITNSLLVGEEKAGEILIDNKIKGYKFLSRHGAKPLYISPGSFISPKTSLELTKKFVKEPHKLPEPLFIAKKYVKKVRKEVFNG